jgi:radical SAM superfamily enzyme YgiQ (UPF0313 family)
MKICLVIAPAKSGDRVPERVYGCTFTYYKQPPLPMLYIASVLKQDKHSVDLKDFTGNNSWHEFTEFIDSADYDLYIFHTVLLAESIDIKAAEYIVEKTPAKIIFFGPHPTLNPRDFVINENVFVARGEAEFIIRDLTRALASGDVGGVKGVSFLKGSEFIETNCYGVIDDLDLLPFPDRSLIDENKLEYFNPKLKQRPVAIILTSRGCSFKCYYCVPNAISWARELEWKRFHDGKKPPVMLRSPENIVAEFRAVKEMGYKAVSVIDDLFIFGGKARILEISKGLKEVGLPFGVLARCDLITDDEMVEALKDAGCEYMDLGVESLDQKVLDDIQKGMKVESVERSIGLLNKYGIEPKVNIMFGSSPLETLQSVKGTIEGVRKLPINYCMFSIATPFPGTEFSKKAKAKGWAIEPEIDNLEENLSPTEKSLVSYPELSKEELEKAVKTANRCFYLSPRRIWYQLKKVASFKALKDLIITGWRVIK